MTHEIPHKRYMEALNSLKDIVRNELVLIDLDARLMEDVSEEGRKEFAEREKTRLLVFLRKDLVRTISRFASLRQVSWKRVKAARAEQFETAAKGMMAHAKKATAVGQTVAAGAELLADEGSARPSLCPPGFVEVDGVCVPI
jgi:hypothetical protein